MVFRSFSYAAGALAGACSSSEWAAMALQVLVVPPSRCGWEGFLSLLRLITRRQGPALEPKWHRAEHLMLRQFILFMLHIFICPSTSLVTPSWGRGRVHMAVAMQENQMAERITWQSLCKQARSSLFGWWHASLPCLFPAVPGPRPVLSQAVMRPASDPFSATESAASDRCKHGRRLFKPQPPCGGCCCGR